MARSNARLVKGVLGVWLALVSALQPAMAVEARCASACGPDNFQTRNLQQFADDVREAILFSLAKDTPLVSTDASSFIVSPHRFLSSPASGQTGRAARLRTAVPVALYLQKVDATGRGEERHATIQPRQHGNKRR